MGIRFLIPYFCNNPQVQTDMHAKFQWLGLTVLARIYEKVPKNHIPGK
jgi:hypothetical protein